MVSRLDIYKWILSFLLLWRYGCGNSVHVKCMKIWAEHQRSTGETIVKCPLCRVDFGSFQVSLHGTLISSPCSSCQHFKQLATSDSLILDIICEQMLQLAWLDSLLHLEPYISDLFYHMVQLIKHKLLNYAINNYFEIGKLRVHSWSLVKWNL